MTSKELPQAEFEVIEIMWSLPSPVTTVQIMSKLSSKNWKMPTLISLLNRLIARGLVYSEKSGRERLYYAKVTEEEFMRLEMRNIINKYEKQPSVFNLISTLYDGRKISVKEKEELIEWLNKR